jgi:hypothetical protein
LKLADREIRNLLPRPSSLLFGAFKLLVVSATKLGLLYDQCLGKGATMAIKRESLDRLIEQAQNDPAFFHGLIFKPEETLAKIDYLERQEKAKILELRPQDVIAGLVGVAGQECDYTCLDTCDITCDESGCNYTKLEEAVDLPMVRRLSRRSFRPMRRFR